MHCIKKPQNVEQQWFMWHVENCYYKFPPSFHYMPLACALLQDWKFYSFTSNLRFKSLSIFLVSSCAINLMTVDQNAVWFSKGLSAHATSSARKKNNNFQSMYVLRRKQMKKTLGVKSSRQLKKIRDTEQLEYESISSEVLRRLLKCNSSVMKC